MLFLDDLFLDINDLLHQLHLLQGMNFLQPTHFLVTDLWFQRLGLRLMQVLNRSKLLDSILQRPGKLSASRMHLHPSILDGFALRVHWIFNAEVLSIRTVVLLCCDLDLSTGSRIFYLSIGWYRHLLSPLLLTVLLISLLEAVGKLLHGIEEAVLEAFLVLTRNGLGRCLFRKLDELFFLLF